MPPGVNDRRVDAEGQRCKFTTNIARLTNGREVEYRAFQQRSLADRDYVHVWVDGVHFNVRLDDDRLCTLVMIGVRPDGTKELIAVEDGYRESAESWKTVLRDLKRRGMRAPVVAVVDGALGFRGCRPRRVAEDP
jgi:transposase-like protein